MSGRNSKPKNNGPASSPSRLEQFGDKFAHDNKKASRKGNADKSSC
ncbi:hypothetical protein [Paenibacillus chungangensis]|uniref:Uncharacterized protein n=1 Tax=Paenibacillus chungangensis TaxID=696535 RepID=A0ABW3HNQ8_9BACL